MCEESTSGADSPHPQPSIRIDDFSFEKDQTHPSHKNQPQLCDADKRELVDVRITPITNGTNCTDKCKRQQIVSDDTEYDADMLSINSEGVCQESNSGAFSTHAQASSIHSSVSKSVVHKTHHSRVIKRQMCDSHEYESVDGKRQQIVSDETSNAAETSILNSTTSVSAGKFEQLVGACTGGLVSTFKPMLKDMIEELGEGIRHELRIKLRDETLERRHHEEMRYKRHRSDNEASNKKQLADIIENTKVLINAPQVAHYSNLSKCRSYIHYKQHGRCNSCPSGKVTKL